MPDKRGKLHVPLSGSMKKLLGLLSTEEDFKVGSFVDGNETTEETEHQGGPYVPQEQRTSWGVPEY